MATRLAGRAKVISVHEQAAWMRAVLHPQFQVRLRGGRYMECVGQIQPTPCAAVYRVRIEYELPKSPRIFVDEPALELRCGEPIPHRYGSDSLCLYLPGAGEWTPGKYIAHTIVPWTSLWLFYYEYWHGTDEWLGGGTHAQSKEA